MSIQEGVVYKQQTDVGNLKVEIKQMKSKTELAMGNVEAEHVMSNIELENTVHKLLNDVAVEKVKR